MENDVLCYGTTLSINCHMSSSTGYGETAQTSLAKHNSLVLLISHTNWLSEWPSLRSISPFQYIQVLSKKYSTENMILQKVFECIRKGNQKFTWIKAGVLSEIPKPNLPFYFPRNSQHVLSYSIKQITQSRKRLTLMPNNLASKTSYCGRFNKQVSHFNNSYCGSFYIPKHDIGWG